MAAISSLLGYLFLVTPLLTGPACPHSQGRFEESVRC